MNMMGINIQNDISGGRDENVMEGKKQAST
jgi:hypothetical protein